MIYCKNQRKVIRFRFANFFGNLTPNNSKRNLTKWRCTSPANFKNVMRTLPPFVLCVNVRVYECQDYFPSVTSFYKSTESWDWLRMGIFPSADKRLEDLINLFPDTYRKTKSGVWVRRSDLNC